MSFVFKLISRKKQLSPHISKVEFDMGLLIVSVWLVQKDGRTYMVDTGLAGMGKTVLEKHLDGDLTAVFLTHGHQDHIGGLPQLREAQPELPVVINSQEFPYISGREPFPDRKKTEKVTFHPADFLSLSDDKAKELLEEVGLLAVPSPGHTPGHTSYYHAEDQVLIAGDMFTSDRKGRLKPPMKIYTGDMEKALASGRRVLETYPQALLTVCHGKEVQQALDQFEAAGGFTSILER